MAGRRISGRTVGKHTSQGQDMLATGTAKLHEGGAVLPGPQGHVPRARAGCVVGFLLSFRCRCRLNEV